MSHKNLKYTYAMKQFFNIRSGESAHRQANRMQEKVDSGQTESYETASEQVDAEEDTEKLNLARNKEDFNKRIKIIEELADAVEARLKLDGKFTLENPNLWSDLNRVDVEESKKIAEKYDLSTDDWGSISFDTYLTLGADSTMWLQEMLNRIFYDVLVNRGILVDTDRNTFLVATRSPKSSSGNASPPILEVLDERLKALNDFLDRPNKESLNAQLLSLKADYEYIIGSRYITQGQSRNLDEVKKHIDLPPDILKRSGENLAAVLKEREESLPGDMGNTDYWAHDLSKVLNKWGSNLAEGVYGSLENIKALTEQQIKHLEQFHSRAAGN